MHPDFNFINHDSWVTIPCMGHHYVQLSWHYLRFKSPVTCVSSLRTQRLSAWILWVFMVSCWIVDGHPCLNKWLARGVSVYCCHKMLYWCWANRTLTANPNPIVCTTSDHVHTITHMGASLSFYLKNILIHLSPYPHSVSIEITASGTRGQEGLDISPDQQVLQVFFLWFYSQRRWSGCSGY